MTTFNCWDRDYSYGLLTIVFIYLPSTYTMAAVFGPGMAGWFSGVWGFVMMIVGVVETYPLPCTDHRDTWL